MKIAFIGQKGIPAKAGGVEKHAQELAIRLAARGHEVFVYVRDNYVDKDLQEYQGVKLIHLPSIATKNLDAISHTFLAVMHALFQKYDVVHFHSIGPSSLSFFTRIFNPKTKLIATYHCQDYFHQKWGILAQLYLRFGEYMICKIPNKTIVVSEILKKLIKTKFNRESVVIPNGANVSWSEKFSELAKWNLQKNEYILTASRLIRHKGIHYLIETFKQLEDQNLANGKKLVIVGDGFYTSDYVTYLKKLAKDRKNIIFTGTQTGKSLQQLFSHSYLFVQPSDSEGLSITLLEAMSYGKAVLVSDIPENLEAIQGHGVSFAHGQVDDLKNKLATLVADQTEVDRIARDGKDFAVVAYDWDRITDRVEAVYKSVIKK